LCALELQLKTIATALVSDDHAPPAPVRTGNMRFLTEIRDHFQSLETQGVFVFELHTVCIDHRSDIVRQVEEITRHVGFQMIAIHAGARSCKPEKMGLASAAATMALHTARLAAKTSKELPRQLGCFSF
jgi:hypothetical protein